jgi:hypothetical protein
MKDVKEEAERWARYQRFAEMKGWTEEERNANYPSWQRRQRWMAIRNEWTRDWMLVGGLTFFLGPIYVFWFWMNGEQWTDVAAFDDLACRYSRGGTVRFIRSPRAHSSRARAY